MLGVSEDLGAKEGDNVIRDDSACFTLEIGVVDAEVGVKPIDFVCDELAGNKSLCEKK